MNIEKILKKKFNNSSDLIIHEMKKIQVIYLQSLCDANRINDYILKNIGLAKSIKDIKEILPGPNLKEISFKEINYYLYNGFTIVYFNKLYAIETKANLIRNVEKPSAETDIYGPKDSFNESIQTNLGLIKRRIKTSNLINDDYVIGRITKTLISVLYLKGITDKNIVKKVESNLINLDIDSIISIGNLKQCLSKENRTTLPTIMESERPDVAVNALLEGKIVIIVDNAPLVIIMPTFLADYINPQVDNYIKSINVNYIKIIRLICLILTLLAPAFYVAYINYNQESIPLQLLTSFAAQRIDVPFPTAMEAIFMLITAAILRESDIRFPTSYGSSVSIVGALILGNAAVAAGLISPIIIIIIAITFITSMVFTDVEMVNSLRYHRFLWLILASVFGLYGLFLGIIVFFIHIGGLEVLGKPYTYPAAPFDPIYFGKTLFRNTNKSDNKRSKILVKTNINKG